MRLTRFALVTLALAGAAHAAAPASVYVGPPAVYGGDRVWFADELEPLADAVAAELARPANGGYRVLPNADLRALRKNTVAGRLPNVAAQCATPPPPARLAELVYPGAIEAEVRVDCKKECKLEVTLLAPHAHEPTAVLVARLPKGETIAQWAARLKRDGLRRPRPEPEGGGMLGVMGTPDTPVQLEQLHQSGPWATPLAVEQLLPHQAALQACETPDARWGDWVLEPYVISVDGNGHVDRCEPAYPDHLAEPSFACRCKVLGTIDFGRASAPRRASFALSTRSNAPLKHGELMPAADLEQTTADDPSAVLGTGFLDAAAMEACLAPLQTTLPRQTVPLTFRVGPDGRVAKVQARWPARFTPTQVACFERALERSTFNCPLTGHAQVTTTVSIGVYKRP